MTFYESQHKARRKTGVLFGYFLLAVICIVIAVNAVVYLTLVMSDAMGVISLAQWLSSPLGWGTALITLAVIAGGSFVRYLKIKSGGDAIAAMAGGRLVLPETRDFLEKRLLNIAEEMAIASGTHVPRVYLLDNEAGINAFVAGYNPNNTILAVTRGALDNLTREELQGVIAHEYSHILNTDTRINLNLIAILAGILLIGQIGESLLRSSRYRAYGYSRSFSSNRRGNASSNLILGLALMAIGYIGLFFGRLIKAAISRQREFLADASSVQFTRNPSGIGGALFKIGTLHQGSHLNSSHAEEMSHMCFGETLKVGFSQMLATHPPIEQRLKAIDPSMPVRMKSRFQQGKLTTADGQTAFTPGGAEGALMPEQVASFQQPAFEQQQAPSELHSSAAAAEEFSADNKHLKASVGTLTPDHVSAAQNVHNAIPENLLEFAHQQEIADSIIYALILTTMNTHGKQAMQMIEQERSGECAAATRDIYYALRERTDSIRLPLLDIALSTLENRDREQKEKILYIARSVIELDKKFTLYEFIYFSLVEKYLEAPAGKQKTIKSYQPVENAIGVLLSATVLASGNTPEAQQTIFQQTITGFSNKDFSALLVRPPNLQTLREATGLLTRLTPLLKQPLIDACVDCILHDQQVTSNEANLLRAICERLDCPMPLITADTSTLKG